jgi:hypothetical protein
VCVCVRARARAYVCVCVCACVHVYGHRHIEHRRRPASTERAAGLGLSRAPKGVCHVSRMCARRCFSTKLQVFSRTKLKVFVTSAVCVCAGVCQCISVCVRACVGAYCVQRARACARACARIDVCVCACARARARVEVSIACNVYVCVRVRACDTVEYVRVQGRAHLRTTCSQTIRAYRQYVLTDNTRLQT